jgi:hypothetical protein
MLRRKAPRWRNGRGAATLLWSALAGVAAAFLLPPKQAHGRVAWIMAAAVFLHFLLDALVHVVGLPLLGESSPKIGLGLWKQMPLELALEAGMVGAGLRLYLRATRGDSFAGRYGLALLLMIVTPLMLVTQATMTTPPPRVGLVASWIILPLLLSGLAFWLDQKRFPIS